MNDFTRTIRVASTALVALAALVAVPIGASAQSSEGGVPAVVAVGGGAVGLDIDFPGVLIPPSPTVELPPEGGGPFDVYEEFPEMGFAEVSTEGALGPDGFAASSAFALIGGDAVSEAEVDCRADLVDGVLATARVDWPELPDVPEFPPPNTERSAVDEGVEFTFVFNEQSLTEGPDGTVGIAVTGVHITAVELETGEQLAEGRIAQASCTMTPGTVPLPPVPPVAPPVRVEPAFTG
jgi:hypothetical protein